MVVASTFCFSIQYIGGREVREREVFSSASEKYEWHSKQSKAVCAHARGHLIKRNRKKTLKLFQNSRVISKSVLDIKTPTFLS